MLTQNYTFYVQKMLGEAVVTWQGLLAIVVFALALVVLLWSSRAIRYRVALFWLGVLASVALFVVASLNAVYTFDERPETLVIETLPDGEPTCGTAWAGWIRSGYGMGNPCPAGCLRGKVLNKQMRMRGFPPWPEFRREMQCWAR